MLVGMDELSIWRTANVVIAAQGKRASAHVADCIGRMLVVGDCERAADWCRIGRAILSLQTPPARRLH